MNKRTTQGFQNKYQPKFHNKGFEEQEEQTRNKSDPNSDSTFQGAYRSEGGRTRRNRDDDDQEGGDGDQGYKGGSRQQKSYQRSGGNKSQSQQQNTQSGSSQGTRTGGSQGSSTRNKGRYSNRNIEDILSQQDSSLSTINEDVDEVLMDLDLKRPRRAYNYFIVEMKDQDKMDNLIDATRKYGPVWKSMNPEDKEKYHEMARKDEQRFKQTLDFVRNKVLSGNQDFVNAKIIYVDECCRKAIEGKERNINMQTVREEARDNWRTLSDEEKKI